MKFKVYETKTGKDVTDDRDWFIDEDGLLWYRTGDVSMPIAAEVSGEYYYKLEIEVQ